MPVTQQDLKSIRNGAKRAKRAREANQREREMQRSAEPPRPKSPRTPHRLRVSYDAMATLSAWFSSPLPKKG